MKLFEVEEDLFTGDRTNRYYKAPIDWSTYPKGVYLACRGSQITYESFTSFNCGTVKKTFTGLHTKNDVKKLISSCDKLVCHCCGKHTADKTAVDAGMRLLGYARTTNFNQIKFFSFNIIVPEDACQFDDETDQDFKARKKKLLFWKLRPEEDFESYKKRTQARIAKIAKEAGMKGFYIIMHADRITQIDGCRQWSPHFHVDGVGFLINQKDFMKKYGFNYSQQSHPINVNDKKSKEDLIHRIAYRKNHSAFYKSKHFSDSIIYYGEVSYRKFKVVDQKKLITNVVDRSGSPYVAIKIPKKYIRSKPFPVIKNKIRTIQNQILLYKKLGFYVYNHHHFRMGDQVYDGLKFEYFPQKLMDDYQFYKKQVYNYKFKLKSGWRENSEFEKDKNDEYLYLVEVEKLQKFFNPLTRKYSLVSSNEFKKGKKCHFSAIDDDFFMYKYFINDDLPVPQ